MNANFEQLLRDTVHDLAGGGRPVDLSGPALRRARLIRTRRRISTVAAGLVLMAGLGFVATRVASFDSTVPPASENTASPSTTAAPSTSTESTSADPGAAPVVLPGGWMIRVAPAPLGAILYDDRQGRYRLMPSGADRLLPSPNGQYLATVRQTDLKITATADERQIATRNFVSDEVIPVWSPDSSRLAFVRYSVDGLRVIVVNLNDTQVTSDATIQCGDWCALKWLENGQRVRVYAGSSRVEVDPTTGHLGGASATPDDPCGARVAGYRIDNESWLCVTATGFAVTSPAGVVTRREPFPTAIGEWAVEGDVSRYVLFRPK
jgi:hypothetical protein